MSRIAFLLTATASTLLASPAHAVIPQQTGGSGGARVSARCSSCTAQQDSARRDRERLLFRIDSLRWEIENRRLTEVERERTATELNLTVRALQRSLNEQSGEVLVRRSPLPRPQPSIAIASTPGVRTRGYLGVTFDGPSAEMEEPGSYTVRWFKYPRIALVEPSSPAERAGVAQGDTLVAFNGTDVVTNDISLTKLLVPDAKITMRVRRDGTSKDLTVVIAETPEYLRRRRETAYVYGTVVPTPGVPPVPAPREVRVYPPDAVVAAPAAPGAVAGEPARIWIDYEGIAGARVETITEGLAKALKVEQGVLIVRARPGTPAYRSGLRDGDVVVRADGKNVTGVPMLRNVIMAGDGNDGVRVVILREQKQREVTLRW
jgi:hypothetical protein